MVYLKAGFSFRCAHYTTIYMLMLEHHRLSGGPVPSDGGVRGELNSGEVKRCSLSICD